jgi:hypothetical protein
MKNQIRVQSLEDFLPNAEAYRAHLLGQPFYDIRHSDGETYKHVSVRPPEEIAPHLSARLGKAVTLDLCLGRINFAGEMPNNAVHTDEAFSTYAYVLYLSNPENCAGGTAFWRHKKHGWLGFPTDQEILRTGKSKKRICLMLREEMNQLDAWEQIHLEEMKFNKCILYPCKQWHSRWPFAAFGADKAEARLINVGFFNAE